MTLATLKKDLTDQILAYLQTEPEWLDWQRIERIVDDEADDAQAAAELGDYAHAQMMELWPSYEDAPANVYNAALALVDWPKAGAFLLAFYL